MLSMSTYLTLTYRSVVWLGLVHAVNASGQWEQLFLLANRSSLDITSAQLGWYPAEFETICL